ncbi:unnamed protein product [Rangifer tarandus platyrhynchus]|uniref:Uncharacterized protein n=1 Tax=Rangifer tarandus platyrhynchus TaxID=3082113 RepID=A0AC59Y563_RANTA
MPYTIRRKNQTSKGGSASQCHGGGAGPPVLRADGIPQDFTASGQGQVGTSQPEAFAEVLGSTLSGILCAGGSPKWQSGLPFISNIYLLAILAKLRYVYRKSRARCIMRNEAGPGGIRHRNLSSSHTLVEDAGAQSEGLEQKLPLKLRRNKALRNKALRNKALSNLFKY